MFKIFGVGQDEKIKKTDNVIQNNIDEKEVGQIAVDILETPYEFVIVAPIAGLDLDDISLSFNNSVLTISGDRDKPSIYSPTNIVRNSECFWGKFVRNIILPDNLDFDNIKASMENNMLVINIPKLKFSTQSIKINRIDS